MDAAVTQQTMTNGMESCGWRHPDAWSPSGAEPAAMDPVAWPGLWARCWGRIRTWRVTPAVVLPRLVRGGPRPGALAACLAHREFDPGRGVPLDAFLFRRVVTSVWTLCRQEWSFGRRARPDEEAGVAMAHSDSFAAPEILEPMTRRPRLLDRP